MIHLAIRNILRNRRRTVITLFLIVSGTFFLAAMRFLAYGLMQDMVTAAIQVESGYLEVAAFGWAENRSLSRALEVTPDIMNKLNVDGVEGTSARVRSGALLSFADRSRFVSVMASDPEKERSMTTMHDMITKGHMPRNVNASGKSGKKIFEAAIGVGLSRSYGMDVGSRFYLISSRFDGSVGAIEAEVKGIYQTNHSNLDSSRIILALDGGNLLFGTGVQDENVSYYTSIALKVDNYLIAERVEEELKEVFPRPTIESGIRPGESANFDPVVLNWEDLNPGVKEMMRVSTWKMDIFLVFFVISISFGILNTVQMSIQERMREFGVLLAIGTKPAQLLRMVLWETFFLVVPGVVFGILMAIGIAEYYHYYPYQLTGNLAEIYASMGMPPRFRPIVNINEMLITGVALIVPAFLMGVIATRRIYRIDPIRIINTI